MGSCWILLFLGAVRWSWCHTVYPLEPPRLTRHGLEEWRPLKEDGGGFAARHSVRYPIYHKSHFVQPPHAKKQTPQQTSDYSDNVEVFSSAPPSILGSLSVFGHATVNAREPASRITKKSPRPLNTPEQPEHQQGYQPFRQYQHSFHHNLHDYQKHHLPFFQTYEERPLIYDHHLRPPSRDHGPEGGLGLMSHPHSSSLTPNSYFFETPQPFQSPQGHGNTLHSLRKPIYKPSVTHSPYRLSSNIPLYHPTSVNPLDQFKTPTHSPLSYESDYERGINKIPKQNLHVSKPNQGGLGFFSLNPFGDIRLSTRRPENTHFKDRHTEKGNGKEVFDQYSHLGRPFQNTNTYSTQLPQHHKEFESFKPFVTTFPSVGSTIASNNVKNSNTQTYQISPNYENREVLPSSKPDYSVTNTPFNDEVYPITVTTIDIPTDTAPENLKPIQESFVESSYQPIKNSWDSPKTKHKNYYTNEQSHVDVTSYQDYRDNIEPTFLPTPSSEVGTYQTVIESELNNDQHEPIKVVSSRKPITIINEVQTMKTPEDTTDYFTTEIPEVTTRYRPFSKNRRRPTKPTDSPKTEQEDSSIKNHRINEAGNTKPEHHKRRRKPSYGTRGSIGYDRNRNSEFKKQRTTTTTTTEEPDVYEPTIYNFDVTAIPITEEPISNHQYFTTDIGIQTELSPSPEIPHYVEKDPENEERTVSNSYENHKMNIYNEEIFTTLPPPPLTTTLAPTLPPTTPPTTTTTEKAVLVYNQATTVSSGRLKNKYGSNRPRFSVKDYRDRLNKATSTTTLTPEEEIEKTNKSFAKDQIDVLKNSIRTRGSSQYKTSTEITISESSTESRRKYKPRIGPSRYRTSTTTSPSLSSSEVVTTTTERLNTFRPSTNRYKPGTGKYYSRYRTSTAAPKEIDDTTPQPNKVVIRPKGVFSAKRRPYPLKTRLDSQREEDTIPTAFDDESIDDSIGPKYGDSLRNIENEVASSSLITKKIDNEATTTSSEEKRFDSDLSILDPISDPTGLEAMRIADLTSSSSNDFKSSGFLNSASSNRHVSKISIPTEEPILPLEAFFQTHSIKDKK